MSHLEAHNWNHKQSRQAIFRVKWSFVSKSSSTSNLIQISKINHGGDYDHYVTRTCLSVASVNQISAIYRKYIGEKLVLDQISQSQLRNYFHMFI